MQTITDILAIILIFLQANLVFVQSGNAQSSYSFGNNEAWTTNPYYGSRGTFFVDVTGDATADAIVVNDDKITVRVSDGTKFLTNAAWTSNPYYGTRGIYFADVTGDRKADAIVVNENGITVRRSDGTKFLPNEAWVSGPYYGSRGTYFADVTGDSKADAIVVNENGITVRRSDGAKFLPNEVWTSNPYYGSHGIYFVDVTEDARADAIVVNDDKITVRRSDGVKFLPNEAWTSSPFYGSRGTYFSRVVYACDNCLTTNSKISADVIAVNDNKISIRPSDGYKFVQPGNQFEPDKYGQSWTSNPYYGSRGTYFADVTGDGRADAIVVNDDKVTVRVAHCACVK